MTCPECGRAAIFRVGNDVECINGHRWHSDVASHTVLPATWTPFKRAAR